MFETVWTAASNALDATVKTLAPWAQRALSLGTRVLALQSVITNSHHNTSWSPDLNYPSIGTANATDLISAQQVHFLRGATQIFFDSKTDEVKEFSRARRLCSSLSLKILSQNQYIQNSALIFHILINVQDETSACTTTFTLQDPSVGSLKKLDGSQVGSQVLTNCYRVPGDCVGRADVIFTPTLYSLQNVIILVVLRNSVTHSTTITLTGKMTYIPITPNIPLPLYTTNVGTVASYQLPATSVNNFNQKTLSYSAFLSTGAPLLSWMGVVNSQTGQLDFNPISGSQGDYNLIFYVADANNVTNRAQVPLALRVVNRPPALQNAIPNQNLRVYDSLSQTYRAEGYFNDPDSLPGLSDLRSMSVSGVPAGLNVTQVDALTIRLERAYVDGSLLGPTILFFKVKDSQNAEATATAIINVQGSSALSVIGELQYQQDAGFVLSLNPSTSPRLNITTPVPGVRRLIVRASPQAGVLGSNVFPGVSNHYDAITGTLTVTMADEAKQHQSYLMFYPAPNVFSNIPIRFDLEDGVNAPVGLDTVIFGNRIFYPFVLNQVPAPVTVFAGDRLSAQNVFANAFSNRGFFPVNYTVDSGLKPWMQFDPLLGNMVFTPRSGDQSVNTLMLRVTQQGNASHTLDIPWSVTVPNRNPVLFNAPPPQSVARGGVLNLTLPANTFVDPDGDAIVLEVLNPPSGTQLTSLNNGTGLRIVYPTGPNTPSSLNFVVRGTDPGGAYATSNIPVSLERGFFMSLAHSFVQFLQDSRQILPQWLSFSTVQGDVVSFIFTSLNTQGGYFVVNATNGVNITNPQAGVLMLVGAPTDMERCLNASLAFQAVPYFKGQVPVTVVGYDGSNAPISLSAQFASISVSHPLKVLVQQSSTSISAVPLRASSGNLPTIQDVDGDTLLFSGTVTQNKTAVPGFIIQTFPQLPVGTSYGGTYLVIPPVGSQGNPGQTAYQIEFMVQAYDAITNALIADKLIKPEAILLVVSNVPLTLNGVMNDQVGLAGYPFDVSVPSAISAVGNNYTIGLQTATGGLAPSWIQLRNDGFYHLNGTVPSTDTATYSFQLLYDDQHGSVQRLSFQWRNQIALNLYAASTQSLLRQNQASARLPNLGVNYPGNENVTVILEVPRLFAAPQVNETLANLSGLTPSRIFNPETDNYEWSVRGSKEQVNAHLNQVPLTLTRNYFGSTQVVMRANNGKNQVALVLAVTVTHLNQPPVLQVQVPPLVCTEGQTCSLTVPPGSFYDPDVAAANDRLSILSGPLPLNTVFDAQTSTYTIGAPAGIYQVQPTAVDLAGLAASMNISITMNLKPPRDWVGEFRSYAPSFSGIVILGPLSMALLLWCVRLRDWQKSRRALDSLVKKELVARYAIYKEKLYEKEVSIGDLDAQLTTIVQQLKGEITPKVLEDVRHFARLVWLYVAAHYNNPTRESVFERRVIRKLVQLSQSIAQSIRDHCTDSRLTVYASLAQALADYLKLELTAQYRLLDVEEKLVMWNELSREVRKSWYQRFWARSSYLMSCGYCGISSEKDMLSNVFRVRAAAAIVSRLKDNGTLLGMLWRVLRHGLGAIPPAPNLEDAEVDRIKVLGLFAEVDPNCRTNLIQGYLDCPITQPQRLMAYRNVLEYLKVFAKAESVRDQANTAIKKKAGMGEKSSTGSLHKPGPGRYDKRQVSEAVTKEGSGLFKVPSGFQRPLSVRPRSSGSSSKRSVTSTELSTPNSRFSRHKVNAVLTVVRTPSNSSDSSLHSESSDEGLARESKQRFVVHNLLTEISIQPSTRVGFAPLQSQIPQKEKALFGDEFLPSRDNPLRRGSNLNAASLFCASRAPQPSVSTVLSTIGARFGHKTPVLSSQRKFG